MKPGDESITQITTFSGTTGWVLVGATLRAFTFWFVGCATSPTGRKQLMIVSQSEMDAMGAQSFTQIQSQTPVDTNPAVNQFVQCVVKPLTEVAQNKTDVKQWDIKVLNSEEINAFALPDGKIGVFTGILKVANTPDQLAAVVGHEIGLQLMAEAGFDPHQAIQLSQNMNQATQGQAPPEWLSDHPANENRIKDLQSHMSEVVKLEEQAHAQGRNPQCTPAT